MFARLAGPPTRQPRWGALARQQPSDGADQPIVRIQIVRLTAVAGHAFRTHLQPDDLLFGHRDAVDQFARGKQVAAAEAALVDDVLRIDLGIVIRNHPAGAERAADLFVGLGQQDHVPRERNAIALQAQERQDLRDRLSLHIERAAAPHLPVPHLRGEWVRLPLAAIGRDHVHVIEQHQRLSCCRRRRGLEPRVDDGLAFRRFVARHRNVVASENGGEKISRLARVAGRIRGIDPDVLLHQPRGLVRRLREHQAGIRTQPSTTRDGSQCQTDDCPKRACFPAIRSHGASNSQRSRAAEVVSGDAGRAIEPTIIFAR